MDSARQGRGKLAGGVSHRITEKTRSAPAGAGESLPPLPGLGSFVNGFRWLTPPANFSGASGSKKRPVRLEPKPSFGFCRNPC